MVDLNALSLPELYRELKRGDLVHRLILLARDEDLGLSGEPGDVTSRACIAESKRLEACVVAREGGVLAGAAVIPEVLSAFGRGLNARVVAKDGSRISGGEVMATVEGPAREVLSAERTLLNLLGRLSGVATRTRAFVEAVAGLPAKILDTRKTTPGLRSLEKYAVRCGGGHCHRIGLYDAVLIKDNHLAGVSADRLGGFVKEAIRLVRSAKAPVRFVEVEVDSLDQFDALLGAGVCGPGAIDIVLLDNFSLADLRTAVAARARAKASVLLEASGGVTLETVRGIGDTGVDRISAGALTHSAIGLDFGLDAA